MHLGLRGVLFHPCCLLESVPGVFAKTLVLANTAARTPVAYGLPDSGPPRVQNIRSAKQRSIYS
jgi:hypothetical protein